MRGFKWVGLAIVAVVGVLVFLRLSDDAAGSEAELTVALDTEVERLDPLTIKNPKTFILSWQIFEGLLALDGEGRLVPKLAKEWSTADFKTWEFAIREGVRFHDSAIFGGNGEGREVTAADVVASYTAFCGASAYPAFLLTDILEGCAEYNAGSTESVSGIRQTGPMTVELDLLKPEPYFLRRLSTAWIAIFPSEALVEANRDDWGLSEVVGTGPFALSSNSDSLVQLERSPNYWASEGLGSIESISFRVIKNDQSRLDAIRNGSVDLMQLPTSLFPAVLETDGTLKGDVGSEVTLAKYSTFNSHMIGFNVNAIDDVNLRRAISYGIDRQEIVDTLFFGMAQVSGGTVPLVMADYAPLVDAASLYDPEKAMLELAKSDYNSEPIELLVHDQASSEQIGQIVQSQLAEIGITVALTKVDFNTAIGRMVQGEAPMFSMYFDYVFSTPELVLANMFASEKRPVPNFWQYSDPEIDAKLEALRSLSRPSSLAQSAQIEEAVVADAPAAFLFQLDSLLLRRRDLPPVSVNAHGHFDFASLGN